MKLTMKLIIAEICKEKRDARVIPVLATELEIQRALSSRGVRYTADAFRAMLHELQRNPDIITHRLMRYNGYSIKGEEI